MDDHRFYMPLSWNDRCDSSNPANSSILYGNSLLLCKKFRKTSWVVCKYRNVSETSGKFCGTKSNDDENKMYDSYDGNDHYGICICHDEKCSDRKNLSGSCMDFSYFFLRVGTIKENEKKEVTYD